MQPFDAVVRWCRAFIWVIMVAKQLLSVAGGTSVVLAAGILSSLLLLALPARLPFRLRALALTAINMCQC